MALMQTVRNRIQNIISQAKNRTAKTGQANRSSDSERLNRPRQ